MAREHVTRDEAILLGRMVEFRREMREADRNNDIGQYANDIRELNNDILLMLDCIVDFREPQTSEQLEDGCGVMVKGEK